ncbi:MAG TPA: hypothetical protein VHM26_16940 [Chitinophagaceae bacterium]|jgi:hypothetical protein|nr:hypothetical protein [Chitinophagaceae bacterium]
MRRSGIIALGSIIITYVLSENRLFAGTMFDTGSSFGQAALGLFTGLFFVTTVVFIYSGKREFSKWENALAVALVLLWIPALLITIFAVFVLGPYAVFINS